MILHTDAAKSYKCKVPGVIDDKVVHAKKRVKKNGKWQWRAPNYVRVVKRKIPGTKKTMFVKAGTQTIDRARRYLKDRISLNQNSTVGWKTLRAMLHSAQYEYWHKNADLWVATGTLCSWEMAKFVSKRSARRDACLLGKMSCLSTHSASALHRTQ